MADKTGNNAPQSVLKMNLFDLLKNIFPYVRPYKWLILATLVLTFIGSLMAQVNAVVLDRAVDAINALMQTSFEWSKATKLLVTISVVLLGKEVLSAFVTFGQRFYGEKMRILVSRDLSLAVVDRILSFRMAFFSAEDNEAGKLQSRIDRGIMSLSNTVNNFFIEILPLFTSAIFALILMFAANVYVGLVALCIVPIYFYLTYVQANHLKGWRRNIFGSHQAVSQGILNIIESISVIKSFNREDIESNRQAVIQNTMTEQQMNTRKLSFFFNGLKSFFEQIGTVLIIILTAYLVLTDYPGMSIGKIMYHVMLFANVSAPIRQLHRIYDDMNDALIYAEGFFSIIHADHEVEDTGKYRPEQVEGSFEMSGVDFTYGNGTKALTDVSLRIESGKITALVGLSGAGKSTIVNLLDKFYHQDCGSITLDGHELREWDTEWLREHVGLVLQKNHIFSGSIEENIRYGNPATHRRRMTMSSGRPSKPISTTRSCNCPTASSRRPCNSAADSNSASPSLACSSRIPPSSSSTNPRPASMPSLPSKSRQVSTPSRPDAPSSSSRTISVRLSMPTRSMSSRKVMSCRAAHPLKSIDRAVSTRTFSMPAHAA